MLANPPYGKSWKKDLEAMGGKDGMRDPRFKVMHQGEELSLVTRSSDGQMLFLANMASKMNAQVPRWAAASPRSTTARRSSPATPARARATSAAGSSRTTGSKPSSPCRSTSSTTPASPPTSGCCPTGSPRTARARCSSSTPASGSSRCARTSARRTASSRPRTSSASAAPSSTSRKPRSRRSSPTPPSATGRSRSSARCACTASSRSRPSRRCASPPATRTSARALRGVRRRPLHRLRQGLAALEKRLADWGNDEDEGDDEEGGSAAPKKGLPEKKKKKLLDPKTWERDGRLVEAATRCARNWATRSSRTTTSSATAWTRAQEGRHQARRRRPEADPQGRELARRDRPAGHRQGAQARQGQGRPAARPVRGDRGRQARASSSTSPTPTCATPSRCRCWKKAASRPSSAARCCPTRPTPGSRRTPPRSATRSASRALLQAAAAAHAGGDQRRHPRHREGGRGAAGWIALAQPDRHAQGLPARQHRRSQADRREHPLARPHPRAQRGRGQGGGSRLLQGVAPQPARHQDPRAQEERQAEDFDRIGTEFHRWLRDAATRSASSRATTITASSTAISTSTAASTCGLSRPRAARARPGARALQRPARLHPAVHAAARPAAARRQRTT
jgi:hypothetical protein